MSETTAAQACADRIKFELDALLLSPSRKAATTLQRSINELEYILLVDRSGATQRPYVLAYHVKCQKCNVTSAVEGADIRNFAPEKSSVPLWLCKDHHPKPTWRQNKD